MQMLITPEEARRLFGFSYFYDSVEPVDNLVAYIEKRHETESFGDLGMMAFLYYSGRIQGIREERLRNKQRSITRETPEAKFGKPIRTTAGLIIPTLSMDYFINTSEGGRLYAVCTAASNEAMRPYKEAKAAWEAAQQNRR